MGDVCGQRLKHGRTARGLFALRGRKAWADQQARQARYSLPTRDRAEPPLDRNRDGPRDRGRLALGGASDPAPRPADQRSPASRRLAEAALRDQDAGHHRPRDGQRQSLLQGPRGLAERPHGLATSRRANVSPPTPEVAPPVNGSDAPPGARRLYRDLRRAGVRLAVERAVPRLVVARPVVRLAVVRPVVLLAVVRLAGARRAVVRLAGARRAVVRLAGARRAGVRLAGARRAVVRLAGARRAVVRLAGARRKSTRLNSSHA